MTITVKQKTKASMTRRPPGPKPKRKKPWVVKLPKPKVLKFKRPKIVRNPDYYVRRDDLGRVLEESQKISFSSPRGLNGKLKLLPQKYFHRHFRCTFQDQEWVNCSGFESGIMPNSLGDMYMDTSEVYNRAYGSFMKNLHWKDAALGITLSQFDKSASMIETRYKQLNTFLKGVTTRRGAKKLRREFGKYIKDGGFAGAKHTKKAADAHLENIFGWQPLYEDIINTLGVLASGEPEGFLTGRGRVYNETTTSLKNGYVTETVTDHRIMRCSVSAKVKVANSNKWMDNRLGLANPTMVVWDVIPWSFVVGMFVNMNQYIKSFTATYGLDISDISVTYSTRGFVDKKATFSNWMYPQLTAPATGKCVYRTKSRTLVGAIPTPKLIWRLPPLTVDTIVMASALTVQQLFRIGKLL